MPDHPSWPAELVEKGAVGLCEACKHGPRMRACSQCSRSAQAVLSALSGDLVPREVALPRTDDRAYDLRQRLNRAVRWLREAEDIARIETPAWPTADRIRSIYEQVTEDVLDGRTTVAPICERLRSAESQADALAEALERIAHGPGAVSYSSQPDAFKKTVHMFREIARSALSPDSNPED